MARLPDRLLVDLSGDGQATVSSWPDGELPREVSRGALSWPLDEEALEELRWYLEDYLQAPYGVWEDAGPAIQAKLNGWGDEVFNSVFVPGPARDAYERARDQGLEIVFRSADPSLLGLPWELMRDSAGPPALGRGGISRSLPIADGAGTLELPGGRLRVLMVISRPAGTFDIRYQMVARPLLRCLHAVRGEVDLTVLRPPTFDALRRVLTQAVDAGEPFHVVHFDGHGATPSHAAADGPGEAVLAFEKPEGGSDRVTASTIATVLTQGKVPVVVLNACQSGAVGKELEASVATALLKAGCAAVVAMGYSVYAVAAAEFMAAFYEALFTGATVGQAVTAGRGRLFERDGRPSPKGDMPLADWLVPVHYLREDVAFPQARTTRPATAPSLDAALDQIRAAAAEPASASDPLAAAGGVFVGRDDLFYQLESAAGLQRVVVLTGSGGTGKTELARGFARWQRDTGGVSDPRLVFWHSFEPGVATFGLDGVIASLGLSAFGDDFARLDRAQRVDQVKQLLKQARVLLVWDNFETVAEMPDPAAATPPLDADGCAELREFLDWVRGHSASMVLITSRAPENWLGPVHRIEVGRLNRAEATEYAGLLLAPFPAASARREQRSFADLLEWLDGHPLAMRVTLPRLDATEPSGLLAGLQGTIPLPTEDEHERLSSLGACITYSFAHLSEDTRRLLPAVTLFQGVADADLLATFSSAEVLLSTRFAGAGRERWVRVLTDAARVGLLTQLRDGVYLIHPALPAYLAAGWYSDDPGRYQQEREAAEIALCATAAAFSEWAIGQIEAGEAAIAYAVIGQHRRTLGAMLGHALDLSAWREAEYIARALDAYWNVRGLSSEADAWADRILRATTEPGQDTPDPGGHAESLWLFTIMRQGDRQQAGRPEKAAQIYQRAVEYLRGQPESEWTQVNICVLYHQLGNTAYVRGRLDEAADWYRQALALEQLGDRTGMADAYYALGNVARDRGQLDEAADWCARAIAIFEELGNWPRLAAGYHQLGNTAYHRGRLDEASGFYRKALIIKRQLGDRPGMANTYHQLGMIAQNRGHLEEAGDWYREALAIVEELGDRPGMARTYHHLGWVAQDRGRLEEAADWYARSLTIREELGDRRGMARTYHQFGCVAALRGRLDEAVDWLARSLAIKEEFGDRPGMALGYLQLGMLAEAQGDTSQALEWIVRSVALFSEFPHPATGPAPGHLVRLTRQLGVAALERTWLRATGQPLPQDVRDYTTGQREGPEGQFEGQPDQNST